MNATSDSATLCNIAPEKWPPRYRTYIGSLDIATPVAGESFALTRITSRRGMIDLGDKRTMEFNIAAREIADDIAREINSDSGEGSFHGLFVCAKDTPSDAELADARMRLEDFYRRLVAAADLEWERSHSHLFITDLDRRAARVSISRGFTIPSPPRNARHAARKSRPVWPSAAPATQSSTRKKPLSGASGPRPMVRELAMLPTAQPIELHLPSRPKSPRPH
jgi:hypothetical protein